MHIWMIECILLIGLIVIWFLWWFPPRHINKMFSSMPQEKHDDELKKLDAIMALRGSFGTIASALAIVVTIVIGIYQYQQQSIKSRRDTVVNALISGLEASDHRNMRAKEVHMNLAFRIVLETDEFEDLHRFVQKPLLTYIEVRDCDCLLKGECEEAKFVHTECDEAVSLYKEFGLNKYE